ncbi:MAG: hypothetical protein HQ567_18160 [Candidatus Nealsonbacteria bacterium]|nr:hypothetical protein [Candidatus Nealsonbacteria bacterium]
MKPWQIAVAASLCLMALGCRVDPNVLFLERQNRLLEDRVFQLQGLVDDLRAGYDPEISHVRSVAPAPSPTDRRETADDEPNGAESMGDAFDAEFDENPGRRMSPDEFRNSFGVPDKPKPIELPKVPDDEPLDQQQDEPEPIGPGIEQPRGGDAPLFNPSSTGTAPTDTGHLAEQLMLDPAFTGGYNADGRPGDEGITVVLQPRDRRGKLLDAAGDVVVVVLDDALPGDEARVARWDFPAAEIARLMETTDPGRGITLNLRWPGATPMHRDLDLFVRYVTPDGRYLEAGQLIRIELPGENSRDENSRDENSPGWTPTESPGPALQLGRRDPPRPLPSIPTVRTRPSTAPRPMAPPREPEPKRPVWSPERP